MAQTMTSPIKNLVSIASLASKKKNNKKTLEFFDFVTIWSELPIQKSASAHQSQMIDNLGNQYYGLLSPGNGVNGLVASLKDINRQKNKTVVT